MRLPSYEFEILFYIHHHSYIKYNDLWIRFSQKNRVVPHYPFIFTKKYNDLQFTQLVDALKNLDLICYTRCDSFEKEDGHVYRKSANLKDFFRSDFSPDDQYPICIRATDLGHIVVEEWYRDHLLFWVPWCITTLIAVLNYLK